MREIVLTIDEKLNKKDVGFVLKKHIGLSDNLICDLKKGDFVRLNDKHCTVRNIVCKNDVLKIIIPEFQTSEIIPKIAPLNIIFEDEDVLLVNKPANMPTHPSRYHTDDTLANVVCGYLDDGFVFRAITRLDKDTTGCVLIAKNRYSADFLSRQMRCQSIKKEYMAICKGVLKEDFTIEANIKRESDYGIKRIVADDGQYAKTDVYPLKNDGKNTLVRVVPKTGRTHQIRVHMAHHQNPLLGDFLYGDKNSNIRTMLHCSKLAFKLPQSDEFVEFTADTPDDFLIK